LCRFDKELFMQRRNAFLTSAIATLALALSACGGTVTGQDNGTSAALTGNSPVQLLAFRRGVGGGCYGQCGYLSVDAKIQNLVYDKRVDIHLFVDQNPEMIWKTGYSGPLEDGFERWHVEHNIGRRDSHIAFKIKYETLHFENGVPIVDQTFWDDNGGSLYVAQ
jgi:hypothetical protein